VTDESQSGSPASDEPVTEERPVTAGESPTAQHQVTPDETVKLPTQISEPGTVTTPLAPARPPIPPPVPPAIAAGPEPEPSPIDKITALIDQRPEVGVGGAFTGGIVFALILKRLGR
jgi:hypothetical protein